MSSSTFSLRPDAREFTPSAASSQVKQNVPPLLAHSPQSYDNDGSTMNETQNSSDSGRSRNFSSNNWHDGGNNAAKPRLNPLAPEFVPTACPSPFNSSTMMPSVYQTVPRQPYSPSPPPLGGQLAPSNTASVGPQQPPMRPIRPASYPTSHHQSDFRVMGGRPLHQPTPPVGPLVPAMDRPPQCFGPEGIVPAVPASQPTPPAQPTTVVYQQCDFPCDQARQASRSSNGSTAVCNQPATSRPSSPIDQQPYASSFPPQMGGTEAPAFNVAYTPPIIQSKGIPGSFDSQTATGAVQLPQGPVRYPPPGNYHSRFTEPVYAPTYCPVYIQQGEAAQIVPHMMLVPPTAGNVIGQAGQPSMVPAAQNQGPTMVHPMNQQQPHAGPRPRYQPPSSNQVPPNAQEAGVPDETLHMQQQASQQNYNQRSGDDYGRQSFHLQKQQGPGRYIGGGRGRGHPRGMPTGGPPSGPGGRGGRGGYSGRGGYNMQRQQDGTHQNGNAYHHQGRPPPVAARMSGDPLWKHQPQQPAPPPQTDHEEKTVRREEQEQKPAAAPSVPAAPKTDTWAERAKRATDKATAPKTQSVTPASNTTGTIPGAAPETSIGPEQQLQRPGSKRKPVPSAVKDKDLSIRNDEGVLPSGQQPQGVKAGPNSKLQQQRGSQEGQQRGPKRDDELGRQSVSGNNKSQQRRERYPKQNSRVSNNEQPPAPSAPSIGVPASPATPSASPEKKWSDILKEKPNDVPTADASTTVSTSLAPPISSPTFVTSTGLIEAPGAAPVSPTASVNNSTQVAVPATPHFVSLPAQPQATQPQATQPQATQPQATQPQATQPRLSPQITQPQLAQPRPSQPLSAIPVASSTLPLQSVTSESPAVRRKIGNAPLPTRPIIGPVAALSPQKAAKASVSFGSIGRLENETDENEPSHTVTQKINDLKPVVREAEAATHVVSKLDVMSAAAVAGDNRKEEAQKPQVFVEVDRGEHDAKVEKARASEEQNLESTNLKINEKTTTLEESLKVAVDDSRDKQSVDLPMERSTSANRSDVDAAEESVRRGSQNKETSSGRPPVPAYLKNISIPTNKVYPTVFLMYIRNAWVKEGELEVTEEQRNACPLPRLLAAGLAAGLRIPEDIRKRPSESHTGDRGRRPVGGRLGGSPMAARGFGPLSKAAAMPTPSSMRGSNTTRHRLERSPSNDGEEVWRESRFSGSPAENPRARMAQNITDRKTVIERKLKAILNKLTIEKFDSLYEQIKQAGMQGEEDVQMLMEMICAKAKMQHHFIRMYADVCVKLEDDMKSIVGDKTNFRRLLVDACQASFNHTLQPIEIPEDLKSEEDRLEYVGIEKDKMKGNMIFVGELHKKKMIAGKVLFSCMDILLQNKGEPQLEALRVLMFASGKTLSVGKFSPQLAEKVDRIRNLIETDETLTSRIKLLLQDVVDDSRVGWVRANKSEGPKTLDQLHHDAAVEDMNTRSNTMRSGHVGGHLGGHPGGSQQMGGPGRSFHQQDDGGYGMSGNKKGGKKGMMGRDMGSSDFRDFHVPKNGRTMDFDLRGQNGMPKSSSRTMESSHAPKQRPIDSFFSSSMSLATPTPPLTAAVSERPHTVSSSHGRPSQPPSVPYDKERCVSKLDGIKAQWFNHCVSDPDYDLAVSELRELLDTMTEVDMPYLIGYTLFLIADARTTEQPFIAKWLMRWKEDQLMTSSDLAKGFEEFLEFRYESTKPDCPRLAQVLIEVVLEEAARNSALPKEIIEKLIERIRVVDSLPPDC